ncbi:uncharacterized protein LOC117172107 [Belonocnema kinseyi]|uniref:uncharacterized protein LOC117172107 n=1 Tax=Belonocnema kinseyi TaxID=2817044 RepID=UPI00143D9E48|nr:uncharacterized protein LOC117172107 [Belonocnema kinseyi]XP_033215779.1 uncharacterized protein LOC117172107 [Belonocnema kinseyi]XP_033215780.1 uncharacterized protein LOC117172107 [Belonocnema kinseyi]XP_033215781.1 uncharacterized protein LOC117172107 [Belonocnema kinseyi]XP_033215782.1 uncharacterized protein LOC117172107 [Belonocnema kinseyi]XP_033215783.1 uncharacterized protein LOC117172107 [Belonocnema kinseyi]XP_033215784.1 uncharacterized protein LOC117172107 [Belonocnema kinsey
MVGLVVGEFETMRGDLNFVTDIRWTLNFPQILLFVILGFFREVEPINITTVNIPKVVKAGTEQNIVLDCIYNMGNSPKTGLVIKWFVNQDLLYQWIHGHKPTGSDEFQKYIDESYKASNDPDTMYRAVKLVRPGHELSGNVRCVISTQYDEVDASRRMLVYSPERVLRLSHSKIDEGTNQVTVRCVAEDVYPRPTIIIRQDKEPISGLNFYYKNNTDGRMNVQAVGVLDVDKLQLPIILQCEVLIREANYSSIQEYIYNGK